MVIFFSIIYLSLSLTHTRSLSLHPSLSIILYSHGLSPTTAHYNFATLQLCQLPVNASITEDKEVQIEGIQLSERQRYKREREGEGDDTERYKKEIESDMGDAEREDRTLD